MAHGVHRAARTPPPPRPRDPVPPSDPAAVPAPRPPQTEGHERASGLTELARETWRRFRAGWAATPERARRRWGGTVLIGLVLCCGGVLAMVALARRWADGGPLADEGAWLLWWTERVPVTADQAVWIEIPGHAVFLIPLVVLGAAVAAWRGRPLRALSWLAAFFALDLVVFAGWLTWDRARPDVVLGGALAPGFHSFPSGHAAQVVSAWGFLAYLWLRTTPHPWERIAAVLLAVVASAGTVVGRLTLGAHWPSDVVAGLIAGLAWLAVVIVALERSEPPGRSAPRAASAEPRA